ncbi:lipase member H-A-like [Acipenser oxyrinchus oxyrinchus]|uniref:Lipase member H-A-like n=1 Tax=Acipenser oxyrinchus oxyrinchus TaxID=40147 RepID=A0AAD8DH79_ACIOX|nr:lipase member H-A-like [Acipenser oxyrinchus oxyrinchus]
MFKWWILILLHPCVLQAEPECKHFTALDFHNSFIGTKLDVKLLLYTNETINCGNHLDHTNFTGSNLLNVKRKTTFVIHGYRPSGSPPVWIDTIVQLLLSAEDMNVIVVDWNRGAATIIYPKAAENTKRVAQILTSFIKQMIEMGSSLSSFHLIGISLGAHISGFVGNMLGGKIGRITGLDPAGPMFTGKPPAERLDPTDAEFVDVLHTDIDALGFREPLGHIDFYANGGTDQPGCPKTIFSGKQYFVCDHQRSVYLFLCSLNKTCEITAYPCSSYQTFLDGKCTECDAFLPAPCPVLGFYVYKWKDALVKLEQTKAYFSTTADPPFCKYNYLLDIITWNKSTRWGYITIKLMNGKNVTESKLDHKASKFEQYTETQLLTQFEKDVENVQKISVKFSTGNVIGPRYKLRVIRMRLKSLDNKNRPHLCRYDLIMEENTEVTFRPIICQDIEM